MLAAILLLLTVVHKQLHQLPDRGFPFSQLSTQFTQLQGRHR